jgi:hypothetical protein
MMRTGARSGVFALQRQTKALLAACCSKIRRNDYKERSDQLTMPFSYRLEDSRQFQFCFSANNRKKLRIVSVEKKTPAQLKVQTGVWVANKCDQATLGSVRPIQKALKLAQGFCAFSVILALLWLSCLKDQLCYLLWV